MKLKKKYAFSILAVAVFGILVFVTYLMQKAGDAAVLTARVTQVTHKPNRAEDGYYGFKVQDNTGKTYTINATGFMNTPQRPSDVGQECVDIPDIKEGQTIEFKLPKSDSSDQTFVTCYKKDSGDYFITLK